MALALFFLFALAAAQYPADPTNCTIFLFDTQVDASFRARGASSASLFRAEKESDATYSSTETHPSVSGGQ